ncbi:MAG: patatin-like phospholipase family protein [Candidatus ainarchaeum sp.]|nr:patatin-like phospholipase family protein [Candidatus ainarchaeum sp.]
MIQRKKVGLALGGGGSKGFAHIGVLQVFEEEGIPVDYICGTSIGSLIGGHYSLYKDIDHLKSDAFSFLKENDLDLFSLLKPGYEKTLKNLQFFLESVYRDHRFSDTKTPFSCTAVNIENGALLDIDDGRLIDAIFASMSIPGLFPARFFWGSWLVDGGVLNNLPVDIVAKKGYDVVIGCDLGDIEALKQIEAKPTRIDALKRSFIIMSDDLTARIKKSVPNAIIINPKIVVSTLRFDYALSKKQIVEGEKSARAKIDEIKKRLK